MVYLGKFLKIRVHEIDRSALWGRTSYDKLVQYLWESGAPGVTAIRSREGLGVHGRLQKLSSDYIGDNLPINLDVFGSAQQIDAICLELEEHLPKDAQAMVMDTVVNLKEEEWGVPFVEAGVVLKVYMKSDDEYDGSPLYHAMVTACRDLNIYWVDAQQALEGFGKDHVIRKNSMFGFADKSPIVFEASFPSSRSEEVFSRLKPLFLKASGPAIALQGEILTAPPDKDNG